MMRPTERAKMYLDGSVTNFRNARLNNSISLIALGLEQMAMSQQELATGLRALYLKLEQMERDAKVPTGGFR